MRSNRQNIIGWQAQALTWLIVVMLTFLSNLQYDGPAQAGTFAINTTLFYAAIIYANATWLIPQFYYRKKYAVYILLLLLVLASSVVARTYLSLYIYNTWFATSKEQLSMRAFSFSAFSAVFILLFSYFFRLALNYFTLSKKQAAITAEKAQAELALLKQQLHPHFLFNTLNNIYYVAGRDSPEAADLIERLSGLMRYFIEEAQKEKVFLKDEIALLKSYIDLESIRMRYEMTVTFEIAGDINRITVPPLLLVPLVENIFKHGVDKRSRDNFAVVQLRVQNSKLLFSAKNRLHPTPGAGRGTGLANLEKRLQLYYGEDYLMQTKQEEEYFTATLEIPVDEN
ncbi:MAG TPA: sensor histidine kinase [Chitinophagaceae bacterium]|nr:sensor histidine kinase [Chitinophagaceae bacterium]